jgi:hypothetical protein
MTHVEAIEGLSQRTGVAPEALEKLPETSLQAAFKKSVNPTHWVLETMAASPFLLSALYTASTGRFVMAGIMAAVGAGLCYDAKSRYEKNQSVTTAVTRELAARIA